MKLRRTTWALAGALVATLAFPATGMAVTGTVTEFPAPTAASGPFGITGGPDGSVWFTEKNKAKLGKVDLSGPTPKLTDFPVGGGTAPYDIVTGPVNQSLWMTDQGANKVYKITNLTAATPTITPQAVAVTSPTGIAVGPDNDLWVTQMAGSVQRVKSSDGTADGPPIPTGGTNLQSIAKGADGSLMWVTDLNDGPAMNNGLINVATTAPFKATPVTIGANKGPRGVEVAADGHVFFAESSTGGEKVGRVNADGSGFQETPALSGGATDPEGVSFGQDGNLYVAVFNGAQVGQVTPALGLTQFKTGITGPTGPREIARGPDGNEWFTNETNNTVGRLTVDAPAPPPPPSGGGNAGGGGGATNGTTPTTPVNNAGTPQVSEVAVKPSRFRVGTRATAVSAAAKAKTGTTITFLLTKDATATLAFDQAVQGRRRGSGCVRINRRNINGRKCTRFIPRGTLTRTALQGLNTVPFTGRIGRRALKPGRYRLGVESTDAEGRTGLFQYATFIVLPPKHKTTRRGR
jgi:virginiamycin B lyase